MDRLYEAINHIKTRADAWAVKVLTNALKDISERLEPCTDAISREDAIRCLIYQGSAEQKIRELPSVNPQPCTDAASRASVIKFEGTNMACMGGDEIMKEFENNTQQPCDDAISREDATAEFIKWQTEVAYAFGRDYLGVRIIQSAIDTIRELPSVTQKSGVWVEIDDEPHEVWECDHCGFVIDGSGCIEPYEYRDIYKYCPNCGAKMESEE